MPMTPDRAQAILNQKCSDQGIGPINLMKAASVLADFKVDEFDSTARASLFAAISVLLELAFQAFDDAGEEQEQEEVA